MERNIKALSEQEFDLVIIGGGISGACIAWDAATRGLKTALIEKKDFGHATSMATSKLIHGGLRYLAQYQFGVVRESLRERRFFEKNLPHLIFPMGFLIPIYNYTPTPKFLLGMGLSMYDLMAYDKNELADPDKHLANHRWLKREEVLQMDPHLDPKGLKGGYYYYDGLNRYPERTNIEFIESASSHGAVVANYVEATNFITQTGDGKITVKGVEARDVTNGNTFNIQGKVVINASGPWGDIMLSKLHKNPVRKLQRSKGIHLVFPRFSSDAALTFETKNKHHFFIIPWLNFSLVGTTDTPYNQSPDELKVTRGEAEDFMRLINDHYPANLTYDKILHAYAGIRPLVAESENESTYQASRKHEIVDHKKVEKVSGLISVFGGKYTTSRSLAEETVDHIVREYHLHAGPCLTRNKPLDGGDLGERYSVFLNHAVEEYGSTYTAEVVEHLVARYGANFRKIIAMFQEDPGAKAPLENTFYTTRGDIRYAIENESAIHLDDFLLRRCGLGNTGTVSAQLLDQIAEIMGEMLQWDKTQKEEEKLKYKEETKIIDDLS